MARSRSIQAYLDAIGATGASGEGLSFRCSADASNRRRLRARRAATAPTRWAISTAGSTCSINCSRRSSEDLERRPARKTLLVFLGDLIDRGPDSRGVVERLRTYRHDSVRPYFLAGNHEEVLLRLLAGERGILASWLKYGGAECLRSYGVRSGVASPALSERAALGYGQGRDSRRSMRGSSAASPTRSVSATICSSTPASVPGIDLSLQSQADLRWIRAPFLEHEDDHGFVVVHGHTISDGIDEQPNRIGIDTGAYRTGILTALGLEGEERWTFDTAVSEPERSRCKCIDFGHY